MRASHSEEAFRELVGEGADLEIRGPQGLTGLQMACRQDSAEEAERWLPYGANLETRSDLPYGGQRASQSIGGAVHISVIVLIALVVHEADFMRAGVQ